ncbi:MAG: cytochrome c oxidase subunit II [Ginsengibacter sp.]
MFISIPYFPNIILLQSVENPASQQADQINRLFNYFNVAAGLMLLLVIFLIIFICIKFRQKKDDTDEPLQTARNNKLETAMIGGPVLLLAFFFYQTITVMKAVSPSVPKERQPDIVITGHQWWWEINYPGANVVAANEVHLPVGKRLLMQMRSADVIHDWWVPELGNKMDLIPNHPNYLWLDINKPGKYIGACSEFCGAQHAWMRINVIAQDENDFNKWLADNAKAAVAPTDSLSLRGAKLFQSKTCAGCHRIQGTAATSDVGPDLTHVAGRLTLLTGLLENNESNLFKWVNHPQEIKPGAHMPDFNFNKDTVNAIVHYLNQLK